MKYELALFDQTYFFDKNSQVDANKVTSIKSEINSTAFTLKSKEELEIYVRNHQQSLINFKNDKISVNESDEILFFS